MIERFHRCSRCGVRYLYQASGDGCGRPENDSVHCPSCKTVINEALKTVPRLFECRYQNVLETERFKDVTLDMLREWQQADESIARRIWPGLVDMVTGDAQDIREIRGRGTGPEGGWVSSAHPYQGIGFRLTTWRQKDDYTIEVPMEWDLREGRFTGRLWR